MKLSIIIPCFNEEKNIPLVLEKLKSVIRRKDIEIILVDNGSTDSSAHVLKKLIPRYRFARMVTVKVNQGYGFGILSGLKHAKGEFIGWTHADLQTDPNDIETALSLIEAGKSKSPVFIKGLRRGRPLFDNFFTWGMGIFETLYLKVPLWDINAQPTIFTKSLRDSWTNPPADFSLDLFALYTARKKGFQIMRFPVFFPPRLHGTSSWNTGIKSKWKFIKRTFDFSVKLKKTL